VIRIPAGMYLTPKMIVVRTVILEENEMYNFNIYDMLEDGIDDGIGKIGKRRMVYALRVAYLCDMHFLVIT
jgi:hypothetical protein